MVLDLNHGHEVTMTMTVNLSQQRLGRVRGYAGCDPEVCGFTWRTSARELLQVSQDLRASGSPRKEGREREELSKEHCAGHHEEAAAERDRPPHLPPTHIYIHKRKRNFLSTNVFMFSNKTVTVVKTSVGLKCQH
jgi:hypothetical protein